MFYWFIFLSIKKELRSQMQHFQSVVFLRCSHMKILIPHSDVHVETLVDLLRYRATIEPENIAYQFLTDDGAEERINYKEFDCKARAIAYQLQRDYKVGDRALLIYPPGLDLITAYFGCLYAGIISVPVYPSMNRKLVEKLQLIINDAKPSVILSTQKISEKIQKLKLVKWAGKTPIIKHLTNKFLATEKSLRNWDLEKLSLFATDNLSGLEDRWQMPVIHRNHLAFLQYTSGSTGNPKGVMVSHNNLLDNLNTIFNWFGLKRDCYAASWLPPYHDMGLIGGILQPLFAGIPCALISPLHFLQNPFIWLETISKYKATASGGPNFAYDYCVKKISEEQKEKLDLSCWKVAFNGAEPIHIDTLNRFVKAFSSCGFNRNAIYPCYGLAENTLFATGMRRGDGFNTLNVSAQALRNNQVILLSAEPSPDKYTLVSSGWIKEGISIVNPNSLKACEQDEVGEVWLSSNSVAHGYWDKSELTEEIFKVSIKKDACGEQYLRTGDLGFIHNGQLYITGRLKDVIIIHGRNYYPQDIERTVEKSHPMLRSSCSAAFSMTFNDEEHLTVVCEMERSLRSSETDYVSICEMIEKAIEQEHELSVHTLVLIPAKSIPKTTSGKIRRKVVKELLRTEELPYEYFWKQQQQNYREVHAYVPPTTEVEKELCSILEELLEQKQIGIHDDLFHLGADSITAAQLLGKIRAQYNIELSAEQVFDNANVSALAKLLQVSEPINYQSIMPVNTDGLIPVSSAQKQLWFLDKLVPNNPFYNLCAVLYLQGSIDVKALQVTLQVIMDRHSILRTTFFEVDGHPYQQISEEQIIHLKQIDLSQFNPDQQQNRLLELVQIEANTPFDLSKGPLNRYILVRLNDAKVALILVMHHIVADGGSINIYTNELYLAYNQIVKQQSIQLPELNISYSDYSAWQNQIDWRDNLNYWKMNLSDAKTRLNLSTDYPRPKLLNYAGERLHLELSQGVTNKLKELASAQSSSLYMVLLAGFAILLQRYSQQDDLIIGTAVSGRTQPELQNLVGFFVDTLPIRIQSQENQSLVAFLQHVREQVLGAMAHQSVPLDEIVKAIAPERTMNISPLFQVMFIMHNNQQPLLKLNGLETRLEFFNVGSKFDLTLELTETSKGIIAGHLEYANELFRPETINRMIGHYKQILLDLANYWQESIKKVNLLTPSEYHSMLVDWNHTHTHYSSDKSISELFEAQVKRVPDHVAVLFEGKKLTYKELNEQSNQLAHYLKGLGVRPETIVGISLDRGFELVISLLAILKAGGAYVPLDPIYPEDRMSFMLEDTQSSVVITNKRYQNKFDQYSGYLICLDQEHTRNSIAQELNTDLNNENEPSQLLYVLYTSGSTGKPKGVMIEQQAMTNFLNYMKEWLQTTDSDHWLSATCIGFDIAGLELYLPLIQGAKVQLVSQETAKDGIALAKLLASEPISVFQATPSRWRLLLEGGWKPDCNLKRICGGEALTPELHYKLTVNNRLIYHVYGPTETTVWSTHIKLNAQSPINIGRPIANTSMYVLDNHQRLVPIGVIGELHLGGDGVARGYLNRPELTTEKFISNPFATKEDKAQQVNLRLYKTGDLVKALPNGNIEYVGRTDFQVKVRGFRIELGEIENLLRQQPQVQDAALVAYDMNGSDKILTAYLVLNVNETKEIKETLRYQLKRVLPDYMIPEVFIFMEKFPLNSNGKLDRKALPQPQYNDIALVEYIAPRTESELLLSQIWEEILQIKPISVMANFFELGGHSLKAIQLMYAIKKQIGIELAISSLFNSPTIADMAQLINEEQTPLSPLVVLNEGGDQLPLFAVHPVSGNVFCYSFLSQKLGENQPFYGLEQTSQLQFKSIKEMATVYVDAMRQIQPHGPYQIIGWSLGGIIAQEMTYQLEQQGEHVAKLYLIDSYPLNQFLEDDEVFAWYDLYRERSQRYSFPLDKSLNDFKNMTHQERVDLFTHQMQAYDVTINFDHFIELIKANLRAGRNHQPQTIKGGAIHIKASETNLFPEIWQPYLKKITTYQFVANHYTLLTENVIDDLVYLFK